MKVSKSAKEKTKIAILNSAVELIIKQGFKATTLREIAKNAGVSNPTIYNYFPTKESLIYGYIEQKHKEAYEILQNNSDFVNYSLREQLQSLIESELELYLEDREFILEIFEIAFSGGWQKLNNIYNTNELFINMVQDMLDIAIEANEINKPPFLEYLPQLFWDYYIMVVAYWVKDSSEMFEDTTEFIDHSLGVIEALLKSDILSKATDLGLFLFKRHFLSSIEKFSISKRGFSGIKRGLKRLLDE
jgi:AcrR family transcriptional regulator